MKHLFSEAFKSELSNAKVIATATISKIEDAVPIGEALLSGGINTIEVTLRTPAALGAMKALADNLPEINIIAGTVIDLDQVSQVMDAGAICGVSPGLNQKILEKALALKFPFAPGIATPSEIELGLEFGCDIFKFFPSENLGGVDFLESMYKPYAHKGIQFIPLGGIHLDNAHKYFRSSCILAIGGSWIVDAKSVQNKDWISIKNKAEEVMALSAKQ
jgi:2-dehydro-3-deoxyphosphogluconate aldolase/(4S)-4-hydroxy-2-oxoglutarate aldolase